MFFAHNVSTNKHFINIYFSNTNKRSKYINLSKYNLKNYKIVNLLDNLHANNQNKNYTSKIYMCKHNNWVFVYLFIYSITNIRVKIFKKNTKINYHNYNNAYQTYLFNKYFYTNNV